MGARNPNVRDHSVWKLVRWCPKPTVGSGDANPDAGSLFHPCVAVALSEPPVGILAAEGDRAGDL